ncbi:hypothetical protein FXO38_27386 [Capsicum annuum]|nr:hypothetical protein FXO38_27386 [Capsicum annuum]
MRGKQLAYPKSYDDADMIMDLSFYKNFKDRYDDLSKIALTSSSTGFNSLAVEILLEEGKIKVYDCNFPALDEVDLFIHIQPLLELFPILLRQSKLMDHFLVGVLMKKSWDFEGRNKDMNLTKNETDVACMSHVLAHIECLLIGTKMDEPMTLLCDKVMANMKEVWAYRVLTGRLEPVYKEDPVK